MVPAGMAGGELDHPGGRRNSQLAPGQQEAKTRELHGGSAGWGAFWVFLIG